MMAEEVKKRAREIALVAEGMIPKGTVFVLVLNDTTVGRVGMATNSGNDKLVKLVLEGCLEKLKGGLEFEHFETPGTKKEPAALLREAAKMLSTKTVKEIEALAEVSSEGSDDLETDIVCSMFYAAREAVDMRRPR